MTNDLISPGVAAQRRKRPGGAWASKAGAFLALSFGAAAMATAAPQGYAFSNVSIVAGGFVDGIQFHPAVQGLAYARTDMGGAYRLDGATRTWIPITDPFGPNDWNLKGVEAIALDPNVPDRVYLALGTYAFNNWAGNGALIRSDDRGQTWARTNLPFKLGANEDGRGMGERLAVDPADGNILFLGTRQVGLWRSADAGATWARVNSFPVTATPRDVGLCMVFPIPGTGTPTQTWYVGVADAGVPNLYRTTDGGATWAAVPNSPAGLMPYRSARAPNGDLYFTFNNGAGPNGITTGGVYRLAPGTGLWTQLLSNGTNQGGFGGLAIDPQDPATLLTATIDRWWPNDEIYRSNDAGATWRRIGANESRSAAASPWLRWGGTDAGLRTGNWVSGLAIDPFDRGRVLYGTGATVWGTDNITANDTGGRVDWVVRGQGIEETAINQIASPPSGPVELLSAMLDLGGFVHNDVKVAPDVLNPNWGGMSGVDYAGAQGLVLARVRSTNPPQVARSADGGLSWSVSTVPVSVGNGRIAVNADGSTMVWNQAGQAHWSADNGATWTPCAGIGQCDVQADRVTAGLFFALQAGTLFRSVDGGRTFTQVATGVGNRQMATVFGQAGNVWVSSNTGLRYSTDSGATFTLAGQVQSADCIGFGKAAIAGAYPAVYIAGTVAGVYGVHRSEDRGLTWLRINDDQHQWGTFDRSISGDPRVYGRFYLATNGRGIVMGEPSVPTPSATASATRTPTPSATASATRTPTPSATASATRTPTPSATASASRTPTHSATASATRTPTPSATASATRTPTHSATASSTRTPTLSATVSPTRTPTLSTTASATKTATPSASTTLTPNDTASPTGTPTSSGTASATATPTPSGTASPTATSTSTGTASATATPTSRRTASATATPTSRDTASATRTLAPSATSSATPTTSPSCTATPTLSPTSANAPSSTATMTRTASSTATGTASATFVETPARTQTPTPGQVEPSTLQIICARPAPNPARLGRAHFSIQCETRADRVVGELFSVSLVKVASASWPGPNAAGWSAVDFEVPGLGAGVYFARFHLEKEQRRSNAVGCTLIMLP